MGINKWEMNNNWCVVNINKRVKVKLTMVVRMVIIDSIWNIILRREWKLR